MSNKILQEIEITTKDVAFTDFTHAILEYLIHTIVEYFFLVLGIIQLL